MIKELKISEFAEVITGGTPSTSVKEYWENGNIPWLNSGELNQTIITSSSNFITEVGLKNSAAKVMPSDSVLIALTGTTTGKTALLTFPASANQSVTGILPSKNHIPKYLFYYLTFIRSKVLGESYGGAQKHISQGYVKNITVPLPPLASQKKIAEILDTADSLRQKDKALIEKYNQLTQSLFLEMFGDPVRNEHNLIIKSIEEVTTHIKDGPHVSPKYSEDGVPILSTRNIRPGKLLLDEMKYVSDETYNDLIRIFKPQFGDVLLTKGGTTGYAKIVDFKWPFCVWVHLAVLRPKPEIINSVYLEAALNSPHVYSQSQRFTQGIANKDLGLKKIAKMKLLVPPMSLQNKFISMVAEIEKQKQLAETSLAQSEALFQSLLQKAFKGELV